MQDNPFAHLFAVLKIGALTLLAKLTVIPESVADEAAIEYLKRHPDAVEQDVGEFAFNQPDTSYLVDHYQFGSGIYHGLDPSVYGTRLIDPYRNGLHTYHRPHGAGPYQGV